MGYGEQLHQIILKSIHKYRSSDPEKSGRTAHQHTHVHRNDIQTTKYRSLQLGLILYHTIPTLKDSEKEGFGKYCGKRRKCW